MVRRVAEVSGDEDEEATTVTEGSDEDTTTFTGAEEDEDASTESPLELLGLGSFLSCLGADDTSSETVAVTAGTAESAEVAEVDLDVLTI